MTMIGRLIPLVAALILVCMGTASAQQKPAAAGKKTNIVVFWGDDIGQSNISAYSHGVMGYKTPNIDRVAKEGMMFTDYYAEQSCTAGRASFITGQHGLRTGMTKVGLPGATLGLQNMLTRVDIDGNSLWPEECISLDEALRAYTVHAAYASFEDRIKGMLKAGMIGDVTVFETDIRSVDPSDLASVRVDYTVTDGNIVYQRT